MNCRPSLPALFGFLLFIVGFVQPARAAELNVYAAVSLTEALTEAGQVFEQRTGNHLVYNFGASSLLAIQIREGAPADIFFSADKAKMDQIEKKGLLAEGLRRDLLSNTLVIVTRPDVNLVIHGPADLARPDVRRIALAEPSSVPAGIYAKEYLKGLKLWGQVIDKVVPTENVRAALAAVESGNVDAGIVYRTDTIASKKVQVVFEVPREDGPAIVYPAGVLKESRSPNEARAFFEFLATPDALDIFRKHGFPIAG